MRIVLLLVCFGMLSGCSDQPRPAKAEDPIIRVKNNYGGGVGLGPVGVGAARTREYEGPASQAPDWAKPTPPAQK